MTQIFVGNLVQSTSENELRGLFERYGRVGSIRVVTGRPSLFAFVSMPNMEDAEEAIARLNKSHLGGRQIVVNEARPSNGPATGSTSGLGISNQNDPDRGVSSQGASRQSERLAALARFKLL